MHPLNSYTAAGALPVKLLQDTRIMSYIRDGYIPPVHVQLIPTNLCNLKCNFCSCSDRQKDQELDYHQITAAMSQMRSHGCKSVTITGGGDPLMYKYINDLIKYIRQDLGIKIGMVSNGTLFEKLRQYQDITWLRVSASDEREPNFSSIEHGVKHGPDIDWAFSYVMTQHPRWDRLQKIIDFANLHKFTHVRLVSDLLDVEKASEFVREAKKQIKNDQKVIYQGRENHTNGRKDCHISLLKPLIGADGGIYPCCGIQYADEPPAKDLLPRHRMGFTEEIGKIWSEQSAFNGSKCKKCYYDDYNELMAVMKYKIDHKEFI